MGSRIVILHTDGSPVKLNEKFTKVLLSDMGFLNSFIYGFEDYIYLQNKDFGYNKKDVNLQGYYTVRSYHVQMYTHYGIPIGSPVELKDLVKFSFTDMVAVPGETITVWALDIGEPYNYFYKTQINEFKIENENGTIIGGKAKKYKKPVYLNSKLAYYELDIPSTAFTSGADFIPEGKQIALRHFFMKNFGDYVEAWTLSNNEKSIYKRFAINIPLKINQIYEQIIVEIITAASFVKMEGNAHGIVDEPNIIDLTPLEEVAFHLLWQWGYWYQPTSPTNDRYKDVLRPVISSANSSSPLLQEYVNYYSSLAAFYTEAYKELNVLKELTDDEKIEKLLKILPVEALKIIPYNIIRNRLKAYIKQGKVTEEEEQHIVRMVLSIADTNADNFLDFLLKKENEVNTNFEVLYKLLDDARTERYPIAAWFVEEQTNRKYFVYAVYELWKKSRYNYYHIPSGVTPNEDGLNPNAYFLNDGIRYYPKYNNVGKILSGSEPVLEFSVTKLEPSNPYYAVLAQDISYEPEKDPQKEMITINKVSSEWVNVVTTGGAVYTKTAPKKEVYGKYHLYQPISLLGYKGDEDLTIPNMEPIPAFLFYYSVEYDKIKDFDAAMVFVAEVTIELALFYFTAGIGNLRHLRHLKYITEINNVRKALVAPETAVLFWRGIKSGTEVVSVSASILSSFFKYQEATEDDEDLKDLNRYLSYFFLALTLGSAGGAIYSSRRTVRAVNEVIKEVERLGSLTPPVPHNLPNDVVDIVYEIRAIALVTRTQFRSRIVSLTSSELGESNHLVDIYDNLADLEKNELWYHFADKVSDTSENLDFWRKLNKTEGLQAAARFNEWKNAPTKYRHLIREIGHLDEVITLRITDRPGYKHLTEPANLPKSGRANNTNNEVGGHAANINLNGSAAEHQFGSTGLKILDPKFHHIFNGPTSQKMIDYLNEVGDIRYSVDPKPGGHLVHRNILIEKPYQPSAPNLSQDFVLNGVVYSRKSMHTRFNPNWTEDDYIHQFAHALNKKGTGTYSRLEKYGHPDHGRSDLWYEKTFKSELIDGTKVTIKFVNYHRYNMGSTFNNHYHSFIPEL